MTTVKTITKKTFNGKDSYTIELSDGKTGYLNEKGSSGGLKAGDPVEYTLEVKQNKQGKDYNLLSVNLAVGQSNAPAPSPPQSPKIGTSVLPGSIASGVIVEYKVQASLRAMEFVINAYIADKLQWDQIKPNHKELTGYLTDAVDEICQG